METAEVICKDGVRLHVRESGRRDGPAVLFLHGWSQSWLSFKHQMTGDLEQRLRLVAVDLRGHGMSGCPRDPGAYGAQAWADDVAAVIDQLELEQPVLVGWSFGGYVVCDYIRAYGQSRIGGINFVGWAVMIGDTEKERALTGRGFEDYYEAAISEDLPTSIEAMRGFVRACTARELPPEDLETVLCFNILVPPHVRKAVATRSRLDNSELLSTLRVPVLVIQGAEDRVTRREAAAHIVRVCPTARESVFEGVGHMPFMEDPAAYNRELSEFVSRCALNHSVAARAAWVRSDASL